MFRDRRILLLGGGFIVLVLSLAWFLVSKQHADPSGSLQPPMQAQALEESSEPGAAGADERADDFEAFLATYDDIQFDDRFLQSYLKENGSSESTWITMVALSSSTESFRDNLSKALQRYPESEVLNSIAAFQEMFGSPLELGHGSAIDQLIEADPDNGLGWYLAATRAFNTGRQEEGVSYYVKAGQSSGVHLFQNKITDVVAGALTGNGYSEAEALAIAVDKVGSFTMNFPRMIQTAGDVIDESRRHKDLGELARANEINQAGFSLGRHFMDLSGAGDFDFVLDLVGAAIAEKFAKELEFDRLPRHFGEENGYLEAFLSEVHDASERMIAGEKRMSEEEYLKYQTLKRVMGWQSASDQMGW
ncbi:MAG: hypothetical protein HRU46_06675 [Verrucomicrobiales bacterium]|nr:hypothetical protein [Verrucomicrobiales bacterium]